MKTFSMMIAAAALAAIGTLGGCSSGPAKAGAAVATAEVRSPVFFRGDGTKADLSDVVNAGRVAEAVLVGENHGHPLGLQTAAQLWSVLAQEESSALAMEFFERDEQTGLDDYLAGITTEEAFRKATNRTASNYPAGHRKMVEDAKGRGRPVIAANAPRRYVRLARTEGFDRLRGLTPEQARLVRVPDALPTGPYQEAFDEFMNGAVATRAPESAEDAEARRKRTEAMFRSQSTWDWTMAESVVRLVSSGRTPTLLVIGRFHIDKEGGTVLAVRAMRPGTRIVTVSFVDAWSEKLREEDLGRADFVVYVGPQPAEAQ